MSPRQGLLATALLIGLCLRLSPVLGSTPEQIIIGGDAREYIQLAEFFVTDERLPGNRFPGYSFLLVGLFAILPFSHEAISLGTTFLLSLVGLGLLWILARRMLGFNGGLLVLFLAAVHPGLVENAGRGLSEELFLVLFFVVLLLYLHVRDRGVLSWQLSVGMSALACWMSLVRPDAAYAMVPLSGMMFWRVRHQGVLTALAKTIPIVALCFLGPKASQIWMEGLGIQSLDARAGRAGLWMEFMIGRMPYSYAFNKETSLSEWILGHHTILELVIIVIKSAVRQLLSLGVSLWSQFAFLLALLGALIYGRDRRDWALPLAVPLAILPQWALMSLWADQDVQRYNLRVVPLLLVFLVAGSHQLATWITERRTIPRFRDWLPAGVVVTALLPAMVPFSLYEAVRPSVDILMVEREQWKPKVSQVQKDLRVIWRQMIDEGITRPQAALKTLEVRDRHDMYAPTHYVLGIAYLLQDDLSRSEGSLSRALEINPFFVEAAVFLAEIYILQDRWDDARHLLERTARLRPDYPLIWYLQGVYHMAKGDLDQAQRHFEEHLRLNRYQYDRHLARLRRVLARRGMGQAGIEAIVAKVETFDPSLTSPPLWAYLTLDLAGLASPIPIDRAYYFLGACAAKKRDSKAAIRYWTAMTQTSPDDVNTWANLGTLHALNSQLDEARQHWLEALNLDPQNKVATNGLRGLEEGRLNAKNVRFGPLQIILPMTRMGSRR